MPNLPLLPGDLGYSCYPADPRTLYLDMFEKGVAVQNTTLTGVILQDAEPAVADRDKVWVRTSGGAPVFPNPWVFYNGIWVAKHPTPASDGRLMLYTGTSASVDTLDGGVAGVVSDNAGPFWTIETAFAYRVPIGVGTLPVTNTVLAVGDNGGVEQADINLLSTQLPAHNHPISLDGDGETAASQNGRLIVGAGTEIDWRGSEASTDVGFTRNQGDGAPITLNRMQPYRAVYFIKRTARIYCTSPIT